MRNVVFTIVAKNYIGLARVLEQSVVKNADADFFIFVADEPHEPESSFKTLPANVFWAKEKLDIKEDLWYQLAFQYNLIEFCTAIKPFCFSYLSDQLQYSKIVYLDPDVYVFNSLEGIFAGLETSTVMITPHILDMHPAFKSDHPDYLFLLNGTFNLGFVGIRINEQSRSVLDWWKRMLLTDCYFDNDRGTATDQKWMNMLPAFLEPAALCINRDRGLNVAPWNYHERKVVQQDGRLFITNRSNNDTSDKTPLTFVHFSGYDYTSFSQNKVVHKKEGLNNFEDVDLVFTKYAEALSASDFTSYSQLKYSYNSFDNGKNILSLHRRLYRRMLDEKKEFGMPFTTGAGSFYSLLKQKKLIDHSTVQADKVTGKTIQGFDKKLGKVNFMAKILKGMVGIRRYSILARFLRRYFKEENQVFLIDKEAGKKLW